MENERVYICINGHENKNRGRQISGVFLSPLPRDRFAYECATEGCRAEAEPITKAQDYLTELLGMRERKAA
jgi:hypothetical protein